MIYIVPAPLEAKLSNGVCHVHPLCASQAENKEGQLPRVPFLQLRDRVAGAPRLRRLPSVRIEFFEKLPYNVFHLIGPMKDATLAEMYGTVPQTFSVRIPSREQDDYCRGSAEFVSAVPFKAVDGTGESENAPESLHVFRGRLKPRQRKIAPVMPRLQLVDPVVMEEWAHVTLQYGSQNLRRHIFVIARRQWEAAGIPRCPLWRADLE